MTRHRLAVGALAVSIVCGCDDSSEDAPASAPIREEAPATREHPGPRRAGSSVAAQDGAAAPQPADAGSATDAQREHAEARARLERAQAEPRLPGAPAFEARRAEILARAKATPVFFVETPRQDGAVSDEVRYYRHRLASTRDPWSVLRQLLPLFAQQPEKGRQTLLREGYLYTEDPKLAYALVSLVRPEHLFDDRNIWVERGARLMRAERRGGSYVYTDELYAGQPVRLIHLDRIGPGAAPESPALHRDLLSLRYELGFERARVLHAARDQLVAELRYGADTWVPTLLRSDGPRLERAAAVIDPELAGQVARLEAEGRRRTQGLQVVRQAILEQVDEQLPFDEPATEVEQEDGKLRRSWRWVYAEGRKSYEVNRDHYRVFDRAGRPLVPQVCVDFLLDSLERAAGTWWSPEGAPPGRTIGSLDFEPLVPRWQLRRAQRFVDFARERSDWFEVLEVPRAERVPMGSKQAFFEYLAAHADDFAAGDIVLIRGMTPWDPKLEHSHMFFVYETDPLSGIPIAVAGNAWIPSVWSWETEVRRTPERSIRYRIRPTLALFEQVLRAGRPEAPAPPPLTPNDEYRTSPLLR